MYEYLLNEFTLLELRYAPCQKHKWTLQKYVYNGHVWECSKWYKSFDNFEDARIYANKLIRKEKHKNE